MVVAVTLVDVLFEHSENSHHADGLLTGTVDAVFVSIQDTQGVIRRLQAVEARLDEILMNFDLKGEKNYIVMETGELAPDGASLKRFK